MHGNFSAAPIETFGGLCATPDRNDVPPFMAVRADNCAWKPGSVEKRPGFTTWYEVSGFEIAALFRWAARPSATNPSGREVVQVMRDGEMRARGADGAAVWSGAGADNRVNANVQPTAIQFYDTLLTALASGNRAVGMGGSLRYASGSAAAALYHRLFLDPPPNAVTLTKLTGGGSMTAGAHAVVVTFKMTDGSMTPPTPWTTVTVASNDRVEVTFDSGGSFDFHSVPQLLGAQSAYVWCSPAGSTADYYFVAEADATAAFVVTISAADGVLTTQEKMDANYLRRTAAPSMPAAVFGPYKSRVCYVGAPHRYYPGSLNTLRSLNTTFEYQGLGWGTPATGGAHAAQSYRMTFDGAAATRGRCMNSGFVIEDLAGRRSRGATQFTNARWGVRILARRSASLTNASLRFGVTGTSGWAVDVPAASIGEKWTLIEEPAPGSSWFNDVKLFVEGIGPGVNGEHIEVCLVEAYDPGSRAPDETVWWSRPVMPREVDLTYGPVVVAAGTGQKLRGGFTLNDRWYYVLEDSLWVTQDNGGEPADWPQERVAEGVGAASYTAIAQGRDWAVMAGPTGCWIFNGGSIGDENNMASEIEDLWNRVAWEQYGSTVWVEVHEELEQIWVGVPLDNATEVSHILVLDFGEGLGSGIGSGGVGRRWSIWTVHPSGRSLSFVDAAGATKTLVPQVSYVRYLDPTVHDDDGTPFAWAWESGPIGRSEGGLALYRRVLMSAEGNGYLGLQLVRASGEEVALLMPTLYSPRRGDATILFSVTDERLGLRLFQTAVAGVWARISRMVLSWRVRPFAEARVQNP